MTFYDCLLEQIKKHPSSQPRDFIKQCYQAARGGDHLLSNLEAAQAYLDKEWDEVKPADGPLYEWISPSIARVNLAPWKEAGLAKDWLFSMFAASSALVAKESCETDYLEDYLTQVTTLLGEESSFVSCSSATWLDALVEYNQMGRPAVHHSPEYRQAEHPAYRIVHQRFIRLIPLLKALSSREPKNPTILAIDGPAASGKTTVAKDLSQILACPTVHMDDFFLPPTLRTPERLAEAGGNVHYERFIEEVVTPLTQRKEKTFSYRIFDCSQMDYDGEQQISLSSAPYLIVEGSYSHHPKFGDYAHITAFCHIEAETQRERILLRNGEEMAKMFETRWIPMEEAYFKAFKIRERAMVQL